jgi:hypothetical protein
MIFSEVINNTSAPICSAQSAEFMKNRLRAKFILTSAVDADEAKKR